VIDLFAGAGGLSIGFSRDARFRILAAVESSRDAAATYRTNHPGVKVYEEDIREICAAQVMKDLDVTSVDVMIGGPPCQAYSVRGKRSPRHDPRATLVEEYLRLLAEFRPRLFLMENVPGLLAVEQGRFFRHVCARFEWLGYRVRHRVLNAADYGVPQLRKRVILVGTRLGRPFGFPRPTHCGRHVVAEGLKPHLTLGEAIGDLPAVESGESSEAYATPPQNGYQAALRGRSTRLLDHEAPRHNDRLLDLIVRIPDGGSARELADAPAWFRNMQSFPDTYCRLWWGRPCTTVTTHFDTPSSSRCIHPKDARALTTREAARLQTFPDDYVFVGSRPSRNTQVGNAVPPSLAGVLASAIAEHFGLGLGAHDRRGFSGPPSRLRRRSGNDIRSCLSAVHAAPAMPEAGEPGHGPSLAAPTVRSAPKRNVSKRTLSFSCSKSMKFLRTPSGIWARLKEEFDFSVDVCASHDNHLLPRYYTEAEDGLRQDWTGEVVWCHPMFDGKIGRWVEKASCSRCTTVLLLPAATHTKYFHEFIYHNPRCEVRFLRKPPRGFRFGHDGGQTDDGNRIGYIRPLMLVVFRNDLDDVAADSGKKNDDPTFVSK
jgi:DNA (cytosine-5)-methyltransferase 1